MNLGKIKELVALGEGEKLDFKETISSAKKIATTIVSFANTKGGQIIIGVKDTGGIRTIKPLEEKFMINEALSKYIKPMLQVELEVIADVKKVLLLVNIPKSATKPHYALGDDNKWWAYIRVNDKTILGTKTVLEVMKRKAQHVDTLFQFTNTERILLQYLTDNHHISLKEFAHLADISLFDASEIIVNLASSNVINIINTEKSEFYCLPTL
jgi:predicted HTH transcriptional regulator